MRTLLNFLIRANMILGAIAVIMFIIAGLMLNNAKADDVVIHPRPIKVLAIDTGVDYDHKDLSRFINDKYKKIENMDFNGHGTHVAGIILKDVCPQVEFIPCTAMMNPSLPKNQQTSSTNVVKCMIVAAKLKVDIINMSAGGEDFNDDEHDAAKILDKLNITMVVSAGNTNSDIKIHPYYPASYEDIKHMIRVGSVNNDHSKAFTSNYGDGVVFENGVDITSALPHSSYGKMSGTSQAAAAYTNRLIKNLCVNRRD